MRFDYTQYFKSCLLLPFELIIFFGVIILIGLIPFIRYIRTNKVEAHRLFSFLIPILFALVAILLQIGKLANGGIYLLDEQEDDAIQVSGVIESIDALHEYEFPRIDPGDGYYNGVLFTINGTKCKGIQKGDFEEGDLVLVTYLPKSGYILTISRAEANSVS